MTVYFTGDDVEKKQALVVRVFRDALFSMDERELEFIKMQVLYHESIHTKLHSVIRFHDAKVSYNLSKVRNPAEY